jgi:hypothetical protein
VNSVPFQAGRKVDRYERWKTERVASWEIPRKRRRKEKNLFWVTWAPLTRCGFKRNARKSAIFLIYLNVDGKDISEERISGDLKIWKRLQIPIASTNSCVKSGKLEESFEGFLFLRLLSLSLSLFWYRKNIQ